MKKGPAPFEEPSVFIIDKLRDKLTLHIARLGKAHFLGTRTFPSEVAKDQLDIFAAVAELVQRRFVAKSDEFAENLALVEETFPLAPPLCLNSFPSIYLC